MPHHSSTPHYNVIIRRMAAPVSARMMDSAQTPHSFLLHQYGNPRGAETETILIYEAIPEASAPSSRHV